LQCDTPGNVIITRPDSHMAFIEAVTDRPHRWPYTSLAATLAEP
jgi:hypothetical protein